MVKQGWIGPASTARRRPCLRCGNASKRQTPHAQHRLCSTQTPPSWTRPDDRDWNATDEVLNEVKRSRPWSRGTAVRPFRLSKRSTLTISDLPVPFVAADQQTSSEQGRHSLIEAKRHPETRRPSTDLLTWRLSPRRYDRLASPQPLSTGLGVDALVRTLLSLTRTKCKPSRRLFFCPRAGREGSGGP
jgi:hypothetical protein